MRAGLEPLLDHLVRILDVARVHREIPVVDARVVIEDDDVENIIVVAQQG